MSKVVDVVSNSNDADGQLARANYGVVGSRVPRDRGSAPQSEDFLWDGLALIQRGDEQFINEPHIGGGNPVASSKGTSYFNDALGTTVGAKKDGKYSPAALTAFGEGTDADKAFFTGKPMVEGLGHAFWMRNYRAGLAKWQTADPMGYPDGWNQLAYCNNGVTSSADLWGCHIVIIGRVTYNLGALFSDEDIDPDKAKDPDYEVYLGDVWLDCNHNYDNPQATFGIGQRNGVLYVTQYTIDGVKCKLSAQMTLSPDSKSPIVEIDQNTKAVDWKWAAKISMDVTVTK